MIVPHIIGGPSAAPGKDAPTYAVYHPGTRERVHDVQASTSADIQRAVATCQEALASWSSTSVLERCSILTRAANFLQDPETKWSEDLRDANRMETDISDWWSQTQVDEIAQGLMALVGFSHEALKEETVAIPGSRVHITREPYGVCLAIPAWNAVHPLTMRSIVTPLLAGNTVILKTSEITPRTQYLWAKLLHEAGVPEAALSVIHIDPKDAPRLMEYLVSDRRVRHINFTGSTRVGSIIAGLAGRHLKPTLMELGGKAPALLLPDANLEVAASHIIFGGFMNAGQLCMSTERVLVQASDYQSLIKTLRTAWRGIEKNRTRVLFNTVGTCRVRGLIDDAINQGADHILEPADEHGNHDNLISPAIIGPVTIQMKLFSEETFAPVVAIVVVPDNGKSEKEVIDEMIRIANDSDYGLTASVWGRDVARATTVAKQLAVGAVHINKQTNHDPPGVPHGGWKSSGWGRFNGEEGIRSFTQTRSVEIPDQDPTAMPLNVFGL